MNYKLLGIVGILLVIIITLGVTITPLFSLSKTNNTIKLGGVFSLSGAGSFWAEGERNGAQLAINEINSNNGINGKKIEFIVEDAETDATKTVTGIQKLKNIDNVVAIVGPTWFGQIADKVARDLKVVMITPSAGVVANPNKYFFDVYPTADLEAKRLTQYVLDNNIKKIAIVYSLNEWSQSMTGNFKYYLKDSNVIIVKEYGTLPDEQEFKTIIDDIKTLNVDAIFGPFAFFPSQGAFSKQLEERDMNVIFLSGSDTDNPILLSTFPEIENTIYAYPNKDAKEQAFIDKYSKIYGSYPSPSAAYAYDAVYLIANALKQDNIKSDKISEYLHNIKDYNGVSNIINFDENGRIRNKDHIIKQVINGKFVEID